MTVRKRGIVAKAAMPFSIANQPSKPIVTIYKVFQ